MDAAGSIDALLGSCESQLRDIEGQYQRSLRAKAIDPRLQVSIKNFLENLRSALDYLAVGIWERHESNLMHKRPLVYFPICSTPDKFTEHMKKTFPHVVSRAPSLYRKLELVQPYCRPENGWLLDFVTLCNENKHQRLTPQVADTITLLRGPGGANIARMEGSGRIIFEEGNVVQGIPIEPGVLDKNSTPQDLDTSLSVRRWTEFKFQLVNSQSALEFLEECLVGIRHMVSDLAPFS